MPKDGSKQVAPQPLSLMARALGAGCEAAIRRPWAVIGAALVLACAALLITGLKLGYRTSRLDLVGSQSEFDKIWRNYIAEFGGDDDAVIVVEGAGRDVVKGAMRELAGQLAQQPRLFQNILHEVDLTTLRAKGLFYLPPVELASVEQFIAQSTPIVRGQWSALGAPAMATALGMKAAAQPHDPLAAAEFDRYLVALSAGLTQNGPYVSPWPAMAGSLAALGQQNSDQLLQNDGKLGFVLLRMVMTDDGNFARGNHTIDELRRVIARVQGWHPGTRIGLTGLPVMENDEMRCGQSSMLYASTISFIAVAVLFVAGFGGLRHAAVANLVLLIGMAWAYGYVTLSVGHLNIISMAFSVTLIGIGVDYGVHYVARYLQLRNENMSCDDALLETSRGVGPAIMTGAVTTAVAFFTTAMTEFTGVAELGIIAGGGLMLCAAAELLVLPAVVALMDQGPLGDRKPKPLPIHRWFDPIFNAPRRALWGTVIFSAFCGVGVHRLWYDHNLLNMQPLGIESVELERKLMNDCRQSLWYALSVADSREELLARKAAFGQLPSVERTEEIISLLPDDVAVKQPLIARIQAQLSELPSSPPIIPVEGPDKLAAALAQIQRGVPPTPAGAALQRRLTELGQQLRSLPAAQCLEALSRFQQHTAGDLLNRLHIVAGMTRIDPPQLSDLPQSLVSRFVSKSGQRHAIRVYGRGDLWDMASLEQFVADVRSVDPQATGNPLHGYESSLQMKRSYEQAAIYALAVILIVLLIDFGNLLHAVLAALPLGFGMLQTFGLMGWADIQLNPANIIALPLMLGIGVDYGVHLVHDYLHQPGRFRPSPSTMVAVLVDSLTTIVAFAALMLASHQGLQSLGRVLTIGVSFCLFNSVVLLPALLAVMSEWRVGKANYTAANDADATTMVPHLARIQPRRAPGAAQPPVHLTHSSAPRPDQINPPRRTAA